MSFFSHIISIIVAPILAVSGMFHAQTNIQPAASTSTDTSSKISAQVINFQDYYPAPSHTQETKVETKVVPPAKKISVVESPTVTSPNTNSNTKTITAADIADFTKAVDLATSKYQEIKTASTMLSSRVRTDSATFSPYVPQIATLANQVLASINSIDTAIDSSILLLGVQKNQAVSSGYVDKEYWINVRIPQIVAEQNDYWKALTSITGVFKQGLLDANQALSTKTVTTQNSQIQQYIDQLKQQNDTLYKPCADWNAQVDANVRAIKKEAAANDGFVTDSQAQYLAIQRAGNAPAQCGSSSVRSASTYSSTQCHYIDNMLDCTSSDGSRTQVHSNGSSFDISQW